MNTLSSKKCIYVPGQSRVAYKYVNEETFCRGNNFTRSSYISDRGADTDFTVRTKNKNYCT